MKIIHLFLFDLVYGYFPSFSLTRVNLEHKVIVNQEDCLDDGSYCYDASECCSQECHHHWPPTTTPVFGVCGDVPDCQVRMRMIRDNKHDN